MRTVSMGLAFAIATILFKTDAGAADLAFGFMMGCIANSIISCSARVPFPTSQAQTKNHHEDIKFLDEKKPEECPFDSQQGIQDFLDRRWSESERLTRERRDQEEMNR
jgi:hypothetical protein